MKEALLSNIYFVTCYYHHYYCYYYYYYYHHHHHHHYYYYYYYYSVYETVFPLQGPGPNLESRALEDYFVVIDRICAVPSNSFSFRSSSVF